MVGFHPETSLVEHLGEYPMNRRAFLSGLIAAPAVIRVAPLMRIAPVPLGDLDVNRFFYGDGLLPIFRTSLPEAAWRAATDAMIFGTGAVEIFEPGMFRHVPLHELPSPLA